MTACSKTISVSLLVLLCFVCPACNSTIEPQPAIQEQFSKDQLIPLAVGNHWIYDNPRGIFSHVDIDSIAYVKRLPYRTPFPDYKALGTDVWYLGINDWQYTMCATPGGILVGGGQRSGSVDHYYTIPKNPQPGDTLMLGATLFTWTGQYDVAVPAGSFTGCYALSHYFFRDNDPRGGIDSTVYYFARGVGLVKAQSQGGQRRNLIGYTVKN